MADALLALTLDHPDLPLRYDLAVMPDAALEPSRAGREGRDTARYLRYYSARLRSTDENLGTQCRDKRKAKQSETWIKVPFARVTSLRCPQYRDFVGVTFDQECRSNKLSNSMRKRQHGNPQVGR